MHNNDMMEFLFETIEPAKAPAQKKKPPKPSAVSQESMLLYEGYQYVGGLLYREPSPLNREGVCGPDNLCKYYYHEKGAILDDFVPILQKIARKKLIFAMDYETGPSRTCGVDKITGRIQTENLSYSTLGNTVGSEPHSSPIFLLAVSIEPRVSHCVDVREARHHPEFLEALAAAVTQGRPIAHNMIFEWMFTKSLCGAEMVCYADSLPMTHILYAGLPDPAIKWLDPLKPPKLRADLGTVIFREMGLEMDKTERGLFTSLHPETGLTDAQVAYACGDVGLLLELVEILRDKLYDKGILHIWDEIEAPFLPILAENKYYGVPIDVDKTMEFRDEAATEAKRLFKLWTERNPTVNPKSSDQLLAFFQKRYSEFVVKDVQDATISVLFEVDEDEPDKLLSGDEDAFILSALRKVLKIHSTYLNPWIISKRHPITGMIHPTFWQAATATGRLSCSSPRRIWAFAV